LTKKSKTAKKVDSDGFEEEESWDEHLNGTKIENEKTNKKKTTTTTTTTTSATTTTTSSPTSDPTEGDYLNGDEKALLESFEYDWKSIEKQHISHQQIDELLREHARNDYLTTTQKSLLKHFGYNFRVLEEQHIPSAEIDRRIKSMILAEHPNRFRSSRLTTTTKKKKPKTRKTTTTQQQQQQQ